MIIIGKPNIDDIEEIQEVFYKTWLATYPNDEIGITSDDIEEKFKDRLTEQSIQKRSDDIFDNSEKKLYLVAKDGLTVVGVCKAIKDENGGQLQAIYVLPDYQEKGIGRMLWAGVERFFDDNKDIVVQVATYNAQAINFYKKLGFVDTGKRFVDKHKMPVSGKFIPEMELVIKP
jgi:ribosomal protein S18 acetylase RimI-like enzyme